MRVAVSILLFLLPGCFGLGSSPTDCPTGAPTAEGIHVVLQEPERAIGYCMTLDGDTEELLRKVGPDGDVWFPAPAPGRYWVSVSVEQERDNYCADNWHAGFNYTSGLAEVDVSRGAVCA